MQKIILDVDTGIDDAIGIILAAMSDEIKIMGITTVSGNIDLESATTNTHRVLKLINKDTEIEVYKGADKPLFRNPRYATEVHGSTGLADQLTDIEVNHKNDKLAWDFMYEEVKKHPNEIIIILTGPETNLAKAFIKYPDMVSLVKKIIIMGGAGDERGNESPVAEFNIAIDPEAAKIVFDSDAEVLMVGLDVTKKTLMTPEYVEKIDARENVKKFVHGATKQYMNKFFIDNGFYGCAMHDPLAVACSFRPDLVKTIHRFVGVETKSEFCDGQTVCDFDNRLNKKPNVHVAVEVKATEFMELLIDRISRVK